MNIRFYKLVCADYACFIRSFCWIALLFSTSLSVHGQSGLQQYTPSVLLSKGQFQARLYNSLYTQNKIRDENGNPVELDQRQSFLINNFGILYGISGSSRLNIGFEVNISTGKYADASAGVFNIFSSDFDQSVSLISSVGAIVKFLPLKNVERLSVQSTFLFPINGDKLESPRFVNHNRYTWFTQIFYDKNFSEKFNIFFEIDLLYRFKAEETQDNFFRVPFGAILSYFPTNKWTIFLNLQHAAAYGTLTGVEEEVFGRLRWYTQLGAGVKYQLTPAVELELSAGSFLWSRNDGAGQAFNLGLRFLK